MQTHDWKVSASYFGTDRVITDRGIQWPNILKFVERVLDGFLYAFEVCLVNMRCPKFFFIYLDVSGELWSSWNFSVTDFFVSSETVRYLGGSGQKFKDIE